MHLRPYLHFNGQCEAAFKFYEQCLGGKITTMMPHRGTPVAEHVPEDWADKILHATLELDGEALNGADIPPESYRQPQGFYVTINLKDETQAQRIFQVLAENGTVELPLQETFWAALFGMLVDRFSIPWMINCARATL